MKNQLKKTKAMSRGTEKSEESGNYLSPNAKAQHIAQEIDKRSRSSTRKLSRVSGCGSDEWSFNVLHDATSPVWDRNSTQDEQIDRALGVAAAMAEIGPEDPIEGMLGAQLVVVHSASMAAFARATRPNISSELFDMHLKHAVKLSRTYAALVEALNRHRGKGEQRIIIERVTVNGGQAVVGAVDAGGRGLQKVEEQPRVQQYIEGSSVETLRSEIEEDGETLSTARDAQREVPTTRRSLNRGAKG